MSTGNKKTFHILSIDGGGILGLYSAGILSNIEKDFFNGEPLSSHFDLITGTSTGGIIALALATGCHTSEIEDFYTRYANRIFPSKRRNRIGLFSNKYSNKQLREGLYEFFGSKKIKDCKTHICIPTINAATCAPLVFKTNNNGSQNRDDECKLVDVALATSAAPTFFPLHHFENYQGLVDGGLWQNTPSLIGLIEALTCFVGEEQAFDDISILSIGNPNSSIKESVDTKSKRSGLLKWKANIISLPMKVNSIGTDYIIKILHRSNSSYLSKYERIECGSLTSDCSSLKLDSADKHSLAKLMELSHQDYNNKKVALTDFFKEEN